VHTRLLPARVNHKPLLCASATCPPPHTHTHTHAHTHTHTQHTLCVLPCRASADTPGLFVGYEYGWRNLTSNHRACRAVQSQVRALCA
jgi:hypothetical protein